MAQIWFGQASADFPKGFPQTWRPEVSLRWRPDELGADVVVSENAPRKWVTQAVLLTDTLANASTAITQWAAEIGRVKTLYISDPGTGTFEGVCLHDAVVTYGPQRVYNATVGNWITGIQLVFSRVAETTP